MKKKDTNRYPKGWNAAKVRDVLQFYENQTEDEAVAEDEAAFGRGQTTVMEIPSAIVGDVLALIADYQKQAKSPNRTKKARRSA